MNDVMIDLETMGTRPGDAIMAIGAVRFGVLGLGEQFYCTVSLESCLQNGLNVTGDTVAWWMNQSEAARKAVLANPIPLYQALSSFATWLGAGAKPWGNGAHFDITLLEEAYRACDLPCPWKFWDVRCYRTLKGLPGVPAARKFAGEKHNALDDAKNQALHAVDCLRALGGAK